MLFQEIPNYEGSQPFAYACYCAEDEVLAFPILCRMYNEGFRLWASRRGARDAAEFRAMQRLTASASIILFMSNSALSLIRSSDPELIACVKSPCLRAVVTLDSADPGDVYALSVPEVIPYSPGNDAPFWLGIYSMPALEKCRGAWPKEKLLLREPTFEDVSVDVLTEEYQNLQKIMIAESIGQLGAKLHQGEDDGKDDPEAYRPPPEPSRDMLEVFDIIDQQEQAARELILSTDFPNQPQEAEFPDPAFDGGEAVPDDPAIGNIFARAKPYVLPGAFRVPTSPWQEEDQEPEAMPNDQAAVPPPAEAASPPAADDSAGDEPLSTPESDHGDTGETDAEAAPQIPQPITIEIIEPPVIDGPALPMMDPEQFSEAARDLSQELDALSGDARQEEETQDSEPQASFEPEPDAEPEPKPAQQVVRAEPVEYTVLEARRVYRIKRSASVPVRVKADRNRAVILHAAEVMQSIPVVAEPIMPLPVVHPSRSWLDMLSLRRADRMERRERRRRELDAVPVMTETSKPKSSENSTPRRKQKNRLSNDHILFDLVEAPVVPARKHPREMSLADILTTPLPLLPAQAESFGASAHAEEPLDDVMPGLAPEADEIPAILLPAGHASDSKTRPKTRHLRPHGAVVDVAEGGGEPEALPRADTPENEEGAEEAAAARPTRRRRKRSVFEAAVENFVAAEDADGAENDE